MVQVQNGQSPRKKGGEAWYGCLPKTKSLHWLFVKNIHWSGWLFVKK